MDATVRVSTRTRTVIAMVTVEKTVADPSIKLSIVKDGVDPAFLCAVFMFAPQ